MAETFRPSDANQITRNYLDSILIEERLIDAEIPSTAFELYGEKFDTPIMTPAFSHLNVFAPERENGMCEYARAAKNAGAVNWVGMGENPQFGEIMEVGAKTIRIVKPYADRNKVYDQIAYAEKTSALAVGIDIDHIFGNDGGHDNVFGEEMTTQSRDEIKDFVRSTKLPFVIKGVLSVRDAVKCVECGVQGIVVSHHHGRLPFAVPPLMVLPEIKKVVGDSLKIFVDCHIDTGADAYKALALGADAVSVGRAMMQPLVKEGAEGVEKLLKQMRDELALLMAFTGCKTLSDIEPTALWINGRRCEK
ncbi:MAG: alpha-hydroxy-acid oxidizing protein [Ruminococcaceae bacterium]|nr:alpha-hydroxy-acid oxidizing protein [Oscillospiraceae bacterium]